MTLPEDIIRQLVSEWVKKAELDFKTAMRLRDEAEFRDVAGFGRPPGSTSNFRSPTSCGVCAFCWKGLIPQRRRPSMRKTG